MQFAEKRLPTLAELDAIAPATRSTCRCVVHRPVGDQYARQARSSQAAASRSALTARSPPTRRLSPALNALRAVQTFDDKKRGTLDALAYAAALGVTSNFDMGGFPDSRPPDHEDEFTFDGAASWTRTPPTTPLLDVHRNGLMKVRVRVFFLTHGQRSWRFRS